MVVKGRRRPSLLVLAALSLLPACALGPPPFRSGTSSSQRSYSADPGAVGEYFHNRLEDLRDIAGVTVTLGPGLLVNVRATQFLQVGGGTFNGLKIGSWHRSAGIWEQWEAEGGLAPIAWMRFLWRGDALGDVNDLCQEETVTMWAGLAREGDHIGPYRQRDHDLDQGLWDLGVGAHLGLIGFDAFVNPVEMVDFLLGWFGADIMGDDYGRSYRRIIERSDVPPSIWKDAARSSAKERDTAALPDLIEALGNGEYDEFAAEAIISTGGEDAVPTLIQIQADPDAVHYQWTYAIEILGELGRRGELSPAVKDEVRQALLDTLDHRYRGREAASALGSWADWTLVPTMMERIVAKMDSEDTERECDILSRVARLRVPTGTDPDFWIAWWEGERENHPELKGLPGYDIDPAVVEAARQARFRSLISRLEDGTATSSDLALIDLTPKPEMVGPLQMYLEHDLPAEKRVMASRSLAQLEGRDPIEALAALVTDPDSRIRWEAARQLTHLNDRRAVLFYIHLRGDPTAILRLRAWGALRAVTGEREIKGRSDWIRWWQVNREDYPPQVLPPGLTEEEILSESD